MNHGVPCFKVVTRSESRNIISKYIIILRNILEIEVMRTLQNFKEKMDTFQETYISKTYNINKTWLFKERHILHRDIILKNLKRRHLV